MDQIMGLFENINFEEIIAFVQKAIEEIQKSGIIDKVIKAITDLVGQITA